ncbi:hypothetical protein Aph01nite_26940 [Acrocarpospora phusangensis]|uniref:Transglycosylase n=1 Tax=Acrocarpospora phusangensis TaxID=1070424 RepID=A0A919QAY1_9ACTN|nr:GlsB/YeaQ/YmgE family stress response membrane protein [Acrocarpospora phusangensis]GIH24384.1 hypothetical protein Aph01nite_26940 [Acrocarpospora phusangensis]
MLTILVAAVITGVIVGGLGRLLLPGRQDIGLPATILAGVVAALLGSGIAYLLDLSSNTFLALVLQLALAVGCVAVVSRMKARKSQH